jgi:hypothetical protein
MAQAIYVSQNSDKIIAAADKSLQQSDADVVVVTLKEKQKAPTSEASLAKQEKPDSQTFELGEKTSNIIVAVEVSNYDGTISYRREVDIVSQVDPAPVIILPASWYEFDQIPKWYRLCWEQEKAAYESFPWWYNAFGMNSSEPSPGWYEGTFEFPIEGNTPSEFPTEISVLNHDSLSSQTNYPWKRIEGYVSNNTIEDIQVITRNTNDAVNYRGSEEGYSPERWSDWKKIDQEDEPETWVFTGEFDISSFGVIDEKQLPLPPNRTFSPSYKNFKVSVDSIEKPVFIPYWNGNTVFLYYYNKIHANTKRVRILRQGQVVLVQDIGSELSGVIEIGEFHLPDKLEFIVQFIHVDSHDCPSWIEEHRVSTRRPMVAETEVEILSVIKKTDNLPYFEVTIKSTSIGRLYKPTSVATAFEIDLSENSHWRTNIINQKLAARLVVKKRALGIETPLGAFLINPIGSASETAGDNEIQDVYNQDGVLEYHENDQFDGNYTIRFFPQKGALSNNSFTDVSTTDTYEFRIAEWTLGCEHGILSGENLAWMLNVSTDSDDRYRYDSWDEEHPVRKWLRMAPIDPQYDSISRLSSMAASRVCFLANINQGFSESVSQEIIDHQILEVRGWKTFYASVDDLFGTWHAFDFSFQMKVQCSHAAKIELHAEHYYARQVPVQPDTSSQGNAAAGPGLQTQQNTQWTESWTGIGNIGTGTTNENTGTTEFSTSPAAPPIKTHILTWAHLSQELHVVDFVSYQKVFFLVWNWMNSILNLSNFLLPPADSDGDEESSGAGVPQNSIPVNNPILPAEEFYITADNYLQFQENCAIAAKMVDEWIRANVRTKYYAKICWHDGTHNWVVLNALPTWGGDDLTTDIGVLMNFEMPQEAEDNITFIPSGIAVATDLLSQYQVSGKTGDQPTPGLKPARGIAKLDMGDFNPNDVDMSGELLSEDGE